MSWLSGFFIGAGMTGWLIAAVQEHRNRPLVLVKRGHLAAEKRRAEQRPKPQDRPLHDATATERAHYVTGYIIAAVALVVLVIVFFIGRGTALSKANDIAAEAIAEATEAQTLANAFKTERDDWKLKSEDASDTIEALESDLTSATDAADLWQQRAEDASATTAAVAADNESLKAEIARLKKPPAPKPAPSAAKPSTSKPASGWQTARASWYGPGFYGKKTASGAVLTEGMMNVAVPNGSTGRFPFGTRIEFAYNGKTCVAVVNDTGAFAKYGRQFDLGPGTAKALGFSGVGTVQWRVV